MVLVELRYMCDISRSLPLTGLSRRHNGLLSSHHGPIRLIRDLTKNVHVHTSERTGGQSLPGNMQASIETRVPARHWYGKDFSLKRREEPRIMVLNNGQVANAEIEKGEGPRF